MFNVYSAFEEITKAFWEKRPTRYHGVGPTDFFWWISSDKTMGFCSDALSLSLIENNCHSNRNSAQRNGQLESQRLEKLEMKRACSNATVQLGVFFPRLSNGVLPFIIYHAEYNLPCMFVVLQCPQHTSDHIWSHRSSTKPRDWSVARWDLSSVF